MRLRDVVILHWLSPTGQFYMWLWGRLNLHLESIFCVWFIWVAAELSPGCPDDRADCVPPKNILKTWSTEQSKELHMDLQDTACSRACPLGGWCSALRWHIPGSVALHWGVTIPRKWSVQGHPIVSHPWNSHLREDPPLSPPATWKFLH